MTGIPVHSLSEFPAAGWFGTLSAFLSAQPSEVFTSLQTHHRIRLLSEPSAAQVRAWRESINSLRGALAALTAERLEALEWGLVLEYELPRERGRRPDAVLLAPGRAVIIEFKGYGFALPEHLDQVEAYARDLSEYHEASHSLRTIAVLVVGGTSREQHGTHVHVTSHSGLTSILVDVLELAEGPAPDLNGWLDSEYMPLPTLVRAARALFEHEPLPRIKRALSAGIPRTVAKLSAVSASARANGERHLALVTGVPGAGKTLVGLQFVYGIPSSSAPAETNESVFLSGNDPLVRVLQHALRSKVFVQDIHGFLRQYGGQSTKIPREHIWVYDEAQRAWDAEKVLSSKRKVAISEPMDFVALAERMPQWAMLVGLIGEGQEIHNGEESGLGLWNDALKEAAARWHVHCPPRLAALFDAAETVTTADELDLTVSLRSHLARDVQEWILHLLAGRLDSAAATASRAQEQGFVMYLSDDLDRCRQYTVSRYAEHSAARYGQVASSKAKNLQQYHVENGRNFTRFMRVGEWFNDPPSSPHSSCMFRETATEFQVQGLELDLPIVCWGDDLWWDGARWATRPSPRSRAKDPHQLRLNSYRVLLSRGRDGVVIFCPPDLEVKTREALLFSGLVLLK